MAQRETSGYNARMNRRLFLSATFAALALSSASFSKPPAGYRIIGQDKGRIVIVSPTGQIEWEVPCGHNSHDIEALKNGNFLLHTAADRVVEMTPGMQVVWEWQSKPVGDYKGRIEIHGFQRLKNGLTMIAETGNKRIIEVDKTGKVVHETPITVERPDSHRDTRRVRKLDNGNYLVCHEGMGIVREYNPKGAIVWEYKLDLNNQPETGGHDGHGVSVFNALRLRNGNTLIGGGNNNRVFEVDKKTGRTVWSVERDELIDTNGKPIHLCWVTGLNVLPNGNILFGNTHAGPDNPQLIEVNRAKKVVWSMRNWDAFGNDLCATQLLNVKGKVLR